MRSPAIRREQFGAFGERLMPVLADIPFDSGGRPEIFDVYNIVKR